MRKITCYLFLILIMLTVTGCGYTREEKKAMKRYEKQGRENAKIFLKEHTDICDEIEKQVRIHYHLLPDEDGQAKEPVPATGDAPDASEE